MRIRRGLIACGLILGVVSFAGLAFGQDARPKTAVARNTAPNPLQIARGARAWAENCGRCHNLRDPKEFTDKSWDVILSQMRVRANLPGQIARDILLFLKASN